MKKILFSGLIILSLASCKSTSNTAVVTAPKVLDDPTTYANTITEDELKEMLYIYASDDFQGRMTGEPGQKKAVEFIKAHYIENNIVSPLGNQDYFQEVPLKSYKTPQVSLTVNGEKLKYFEDYVSASAGSTQILNTQDIIYVGYGVKTENYDSYNSIDVTGKIVVAKSGEPKNDNGTYIVSGTNEKSKWSNGRQGSRSKRDVAKENGAIAFFMIDDVMFKRYSAYYKRLADADKSSGLSLPREKSLFNFFVSKDTGERLVPNYESIDTAIKLNTTITLDYKSNEQDVQSENVISYIKGSQKPEEYIIVSAHLDHVGTNDKGEVFNGADDDGSGSVAVLEIAEAFQKAVQDGYRPKRSIVFLHVTGEELGLLGSAYYTDFEPIFPLEDTVANLNIDMIGRTDPKRESENRNYLYLIGSDKLSTELHNISENINAKYTNIEFDYKYNDDNDPNRFYYRSDHYNFAKNNVPVIFYFNGTHEDYHQIGDTPDKIQYDLLANRAKLVFYTAWELANRENRIIVDKAEPKP
ncbi:MAG: M28 family peptidase [bacterium]